MRFAYGLWLRTQANVFPEEKWCRSIYHSRRGKSKKRAGDLQASLKQNDWIRERAGK